LGGQIITKLQPHIMTTANQLKTMHLAFIFPFILIAGCAQNENRTQQNIFIPIIDENYLYLENENRTSAFLIKKEGMSQIIGSENVSWKIDASTLTIIAKGKYQIQYLDGDLIEWDNGAIIGKYNPNKVIKISGR
jgi:hypothetical protein